MVADGNDCPNDSSSERAWSPKKRGVGRVEPLPSEDLGRHIHRPKPEPIRNQGTGHQSWWRFPTLHKKKTHAADHSTELSKSSVVAGRAEQRSEVSLLTGESADYRSSADTNEYRITARKVRGLQIGERNLQINAYEYEVERPDVDFSAVLSRADVREALKALSYDPDNAELQRNADRVLAQGPLLRKQPELRVEHSTMCSERQSSLFEAFIFVRKCEGVQIGNDGTQKNRFAYVVAPSVHARQLLADDPSVRAEFIRCVCSTEVDRGEDKFRDELAGALEDAILNSPDIRTGTSIRLSARGGVDIAGGDGVQVDIGGKGRQENTASVLVVIPESVVRPLREERYSMGTKPSITNEARDTPVADLPPIDPKAQPPAWGNPIPRI